MAFTLTDIVNRIKFYAPVGVELPRDEVTNAIETAVVDDWANDAAGEINDRRGVTTAAETVLTLVATTQDYDVPPDAIHVDAVIRSRNYPAARNVLDIPVNAAGVGFLSTGRIPTGQQWTPGLDLIGRMSESRENLEADYTMFEGKIRLLFPMVAGEKVTVRYSKSDRTFTTLPNRFFEMIVFFCLSRNLDWYLAKYGAPVQTDGDRFDSTQVVYERQRDRFDELWERALGRIQRQTN